MSINNLFYSIDTQGLTKTYDSVTKEHCHIAPRSSLTHNTILKAEATHKLPFFQIVRNMQEIPQFCSDYKDDKFFSRKIKTSYLVFILCV